MGTLQREIPLSDCLEFFVAPRGEKVCSLCALAAYDSQIRLQQLQMGKLVPSSFGVTVPRGGKAEERLPALLQARQPLQTSPQ